MIIKCAKCKHYLDDEFRMTNCPHDAFRANDGLNNFSVHNNAYLSVEAPQVSYIIDEINE